MDGEPSYPVEYVVVDIRRDGMPRAPRSSPGTRASAVTSRSDATPGLRACLQTQSGPVLVLVLVLVATRPRAPGFEDEDGDEDEDEDEDGIGSERLWRRERLRIATAVPPPCAVAPPGT